VYGRLGRWFTQEDSIKLAEGLNLYGFAGGDPVNFSNPFGLCPECRFHEFVNGVGRRVAPLDAAGESVAKVALEYSSANDLINAIAEGSVFDGAMAAASMLPIGRAGKAISKLPTDQAADLAHYLGFVRRVKDAPFDSHGQQVFTNGKKFISQDVDGHGPGVWKIFNKRGQREATTDALLNPIRK